MFSLSCRSWVIWIAIAALAAWSGATARADEELLAVDTSLDELRALSLEQLMQVDVTSVAGVEQGWFSTPAAIYVITNEDVRRTGHRRLPEALRLAPGVFVGQLNSQMHTVGARGANGDLFNKTLVLIDGRSVYDPLFGATFYNSVDILMEDLDRIEVIRGPGPTLWGVNAVNGVINVTTRSAEDTQGWYLGGGAGTEERGFGEVRYGGQVGEDAYFRVWTKYFNRDGQEQQDGSDAHDDWDQTRAGFRFDADGDEGAHFMAEGDIYYSDRMGEFITLPTGDPSIDDERVAGGHLLGRITQDTDTGGWSLQTYWDHKQLATNAGFEIDRDTFDGEFRHWFDLSERHEVMWGLHTRYWQDDSSAGVNTELVPDERDYKIFSAFIQDTITIVPERLFAMLGTKVGHNDFTGWEVQPSARLWWTPSSNQTLWAAVSRAVRVPSRAEEDGRFTLAPGFFLTGDDDLGPEKLLAYEAGYRIRPLEPMTIDLAVFYNDYEDLIGLAPTLTRFSDHADGESYGGEVAVGWRVAPNWRLEGSYSYVQVQVHGNILQVGPEDSTPHHLAQLRSYYNITDDLELNLAAYYVDVVPARNADSYIRFDVGVTWRPNDWLELTVWGQNLLDRSHREFSGRDEVERSAYFMATLRF